MPDDLPVDPDVTIPSQPQDNSTPFGPPDSPIRDMGQPESAENKEINPDHQVFDNEIDPHELYDVGPTAAAEAAEPNADSDVVGYNPEHDQRKQD